MPTDLPNCNPPWLISAALPAQAKSATRPDLSLVRVLSPFWIATGAVDLLLSMALGGGFGQLALHSIALVLGFHGWHRALHDPRSGRLFRQHQRHHVHNYPPQRPDTPRYLCDGGAAQEWSLALVALGLLALSALLGMSLPVLAGCALSDLALLVAGEGLHRAMHTSGTPLLRFRWFRDLRALHLRHHSDPTTHFGIVEYGVDGLLGSLRRPVVSHAAEVEAVAPALPTGQPPRSELGA